MAAKSSAKVRSLRVRQRLPPRGSWQNRQVLTEGVQPPWVSRLRKSAFFIFFAAFLFFPLDKPPIFRYNRARSGGKRRTNLSDHGPVAQLVEQRSPKPRAVSSRLTTPATNTRSSRFGCFVLPISRPRFPLRAKRKVFCPFLKFVLDKAAFFGYNKARSGGKHRTKLERSWPGSSVG